MILVISDSHGKGSRIDELLWRYREKNTRPEAILFLGDGLRDLDALSFDGIPIYAVKGNCDFYTIRDGIEVPEERILQFSEYTVVMMHGHKYGVKGGIGAAVAHATAVGADILCFGHTHIPLEQYLPANEEMGRKKPLYILNPGSLGQPHDGLPSFGVIDITKSGIMLSHGKL